MGRQAEGAWYRKAKDTWYATLDGRKVSLGVKGKDNRKAAHTRPEVAALVTRIESALGVIHAALAEIKRLQNPPQEPPQPQSKAG